MVILMAKKQESILKILARLAGGPCFLLMAAMLAVEQSFWALVCLLAGIHVLYGEEPGPSQRRGTSRAKASGTRSGSAFARSNCAHGKRQPLRSGMASAGAGTDDDIHEFAINPATGLPIAGGRTYGVDVGGNVYGTTSATYEPSYDYSSDAFSSDY